MSWNVLRSQTDEQSTAGVGSRRQHVWFI